MVKWSYSGLKQYTNCPHQYQQVKVLQRYPVKVTSQMQYGTDVHKALEDYVRDDVPLPLFYAKFKKMVDSLKEIPGNRYIEHKMALRADSTPCGFADDDYWVRGIADLLIINGGSAFIIDYKTGSNKYPDPAQLKLMALMVFAHFPNVLEVKAGLLFVVHNSFLTEDYKRDDIGKYWDYFAPSLKRLERSFSEDWWPANPTPLCRWCPVKTCEFHKE